MIDGRYQDRVKYVKKKNFLLKLCVSLPVIAAFFSFVVVVVVAAGRMKVAKRKKNLLLLWIRLFFPSPDNSCTMYQAVRRRSLFI